MKKACVFMFAAVAAATLNAATINQVIVRQQWPWSIKIKVEYSLSGVDASHPVDIAVSTFNGDDPLPSTNLRAAIEGNLYGITEEFGEFYIDPVIAYGTEKIGMTKFKVKLAVSDSSANIGETLYKIFDLTNGGCTDVTRRDLLNGKYGAVETDFGRIGDGFNTTLSDVIIWTGVTNYPGVKTTKLVMRKIPAKNVTWSMGACDTDIAYGKTTSGQRHDVTLTKDYFMGVFPVTQRQYVLMTGFDNPSYFKNLAESDSRPVETRKYNTVVTAVLPKIQAATSVSEFTLPSEAQWEFACRAGATNELNSGKTLTAAHAQEVAWCSDNANNETHPVGLLAPNAFGLYDMHGNVGEGCLDWFSSSESGYGDGSAVVDPTGPAMDPSGSGERVTRGGYYTLQGGHYLIGSPGRNKHSGEYRTYGFRLAFVCD